MGLKYIGNGDWLFGVPARDLTEAEVKEYGETEMLAVRGSSGNALYRKFTQAEIAETRKAAAKAESGVPEEDGK